MQLCAEMWNKLFLGSSALTVVACAIFALTAHGEVMEQGLSFPSDVV